MTLEKTSASFEHEERVKTNEKLDLSEIKNDVEALQMVDEVWLANEKKLVRKLDMTLMPVIWVLYLFNYLDRNNIA